MKCVGRVWEVSVHVSIGCVHSYAYTHLPTLSHILPPGSVGKEECGRDCREGGCGECREGGSVTVMGWLWSCGERGNREERDGRRGRWARDSIMDTTRPTQVPP